MDKLLFGKLLGEMYRIQNKLGIGYVGEATIYGLVNGFDDVIDEEIESIGHVTHDEIRAVVEVLNPYHLDPKKFEELDGYYDVEDDLESRGIDRPKAKAILKYFNANGQFRAVIDKFNSMNSPIECKTFDLNEWEK